MLKNTPLISIIILTYNTKELTINCLKNLKKSIDYLNKKVEVILVENGTDGTGKLVEEKYSWVKVIFPNENTGFAKGNNLALKKVNSQSEFILLLNSDAMVKEETLNKSVEFMESRKTAAVVGPRLYFPDGKLQPSAGFVPTPFNIVTWISGIDLIPFISRLIPQYHPRYKSFFEKTRKVGWVMGAYFFAKREVFTKTDGFDENLFMYLEEVDLCKRINDYGMQVWHTPEFSVVHNDKGSQMGDSSNAIKKEIEGIKYYIKKYYRKNIRWIFMLTRTFLYLRFLVFKLLKNKFKAKIYKDVLLEFDRRSASQPGQGIGF